MNPQDTILDVRNPVGVAVVGCGYWGPNLVRNFAACPATYIVAICDLDSDRLDRTGRLCPQARAVRDVRDVLTDARVEAVAVATPAGTHAELVTAALEAGKHVLVEKPLATTAADAERLVRLAERRGRVLMVDHTYVYSPAVRKIKDLVREGALGELYYIDSVRI